MKKSLITLLAVAFISAMALPVLAGNGAPSGAHYSLNIIGVKNPKTADMTDKGGHVIFVPLKGNCQILLSAGEFQVLDANGTDGPAAFQLPNPDPLNTGTTAYSVYARALGKPGGSSITKTCATVVEGDLAGEELCSTYQMLLVRDKGKSSFTNVSKELLYIYADINDDGNIERVPLFDPQMEGYYWDYENTNLKLAQLRFYQVPTEVPAP